MKALKQIKSALIMLLFTGAIAAFSACKESRDEPENPDATDGSFWNPEILGEWYNPQFLFFNNGPSERTFGHDVYIIFKDSKHLLTKYYTELYYEGETNVGRKVINGPTYIYSMTKDRILIYENKSGKLGSPIFNIQYKLDGYSLTLVQYGKIKFPDFDLGPVDFTFPIDDVMTYTKVGKNRSPLMY